MRLSDVLFFRAREGAGVLFHSMLRASLRRGASNQHLLDLAEEQSVKIPLSVMCLNQSGIRKILSQQISRI